MTIPMQRSIKVMWVVMVVSALALGGVAHAAPTPQSQTAPIPLATACAIALKARPGTIMDAELETERGVSSQVGVGSCFTVQLPAAISIRQRDQGLILDA